MVVLCLAKDLPEFIEVDLADADVGTIIHLSDLKIPAGVELKDLHLGEDHDLPVVSVNATKGGGDDAVDEEGASEE